MKDVKCRLLAIKCYRSSESDGDEVYLEMNGKKIWPTTDKWHRMHGEAETRLNLPLPEQEPKSLKIDLFDADTFVDDLLGSFNLDLQGSMGTFTTDLAQRKMGAHYCLKWETYR